MIPDASEASEPMTGDRVWARYQPFLRHRGYELRPRYQPDWTPSWRGKVKEGAGGLFGNYEDSLGIHVFNHFHSISLKNVDANGFRHSSSQL